MRALMYDRFGDESVLSVRTVADLVARDDEVLVRISHASLNPIDYKLRQGMLVVAPPRPAIPGKDFAGEVIAVGAKVQGFEKGQRVFGSIDPMRGKGSCAELIAITPNLLAPIPDGVSNEVAAALPVASGTALQALRDKGLIKAGHAVLITGASGAVGSSAVQIAKSLGARVTGVCSTSNVQYVRSIGADEVIDYKSSDWRAIEARYDIVFDAAASNTFADARPRMTARGVYINTTPRPATFGAALWAGLTSKQRCVPFLLATDRALLDALAALAKSNILVPRIARRCALEDVPAAQRDMADGKLAGKVSVEIG